MKKSRKEEVRRAERASKKAEAAKRLKEELRVKVEGRREDVKLRHVPRRDES
jgi:hypothetical protein